jgi:enamine deaminase RidA (YjgF/YER057c/UK114 family)
MPVKQVVLTENAPPPLAGVLNQAIIANGTVYCSGQVAIDPATGKMVEGDVKARTVSLNMIIKSFCHARLTLNVSQL